MSSFSFLFLGSFQIIRDGQCFTPKLRSKTLAIIAYLAYAPRPLRRKFLADLFCGEANDQAASLRWYLSRIRKVLGKEFLQTDGANVFLLHERSETDVLRFTERLRSSLETLEDDLLGECLRLYQGAFLQEMDVRGASDFDIWLSGERSRLALLYENAGMEWIQRLIRKGEQLEAIEWAQNLLDSDPLREEVHSLLMWLYARNGQRVSAIEQYKLCKKIRRDALDVEPLEETEELYLQVLEGDFSPAWGASFGRELSDKGKSEKLELEEKESHVQTQEVLDVFVGRKEALDILSKKWSCAISEKEEFWVIEAVAGGGKTAFLRHFVASTNIPLVCWASCYESEMNLPYHPWIMILEQYRMSLSTAEQEQLPHFVKEQLVRLQPQLADLWQLEVALMPPVSGGELTHFYAGIKFFLLEHIKSRPLLVVLEDLQWADDASLQLFHFLARSEQKAKFLLLGSLQRTDFEERDAIKKLTSDLGRLSSEAFYQLEAFQKEDVFELVEKSHQNLREELAQKICDEVLLQTAGHPYFASEFLQTLQLEENEAFHFEFSPKLLELLNKKWKPLSRMERQVFEAMAVFEKPVTLFLLQKISARTEDEVIDSLELGLEQKTIQTLEQKEEVFSFTQTIFRHFVFEQIGSLRKKRLHRRCAEFLEESNEKSAVIAYHWRLGKSFEKELYHVKRALKEAISCYAYIDALPWVERGLELESSGSGWILLIRKQGELFQLLGRWEEAESCFLKAQEESEKSGLVEEHTLSTLALGLFWLAKGNYKGAIKSFLKAQKEYQKRNDSMGACQVLGGLGRTYRKQGQLKKGLTCYQEKAKLAKKLKDNRALCEALGEMSLIYLQQGAISKASDCFEQTLDISIREEKLLQEEEQELGVDNLEAEAQFTISKIMNHASFFTERKDAYLAALSYFEQQIDSSQKNHGFREIDRLGVLYTWKADYQKAIFWIQKHFEWAVKQFSFSGLSKAAGRMGEIYLECGALDWSESCYVYKLSVSLDLKERRGTAVALGRLAHLLFWQAEPKRYFELLSPSHLVDRVQEPNALKMATLALDVANRICQKSGFVADGLQFSLLRARLLLAKGFFEEAWSLLEKIIASADEMGLESVFFEAKLLSFCVISILDLELSHNMLEELALLANSSKSDEKKARANEVRAFIYDLLGDSKLASKERKMAGKLWKALYRQTPKQEYAFRHELLTGKTIEQDLALAMLPEQISLSHTTLKELLDKVKRNEM